MYKLTKTYKTVGGAVRACVDRLCEMEARAEMRGMSFDWTATATPLAKNILRQRLVGEIAPDAIPNQNLGQWISDLLNTEIGKRHASDLKQVASMLRGGPR